MIKQLLCLCIAVFAFCNIGKAQQQQGQQDITPESPLYQNLKEQGNFFGFSQGYIPQNNTEITAPVFAEDEGTPKQTTSCNCLLPIDNTFQVVPFTNGTPPQYRNDDGSTNLINLPFSFCFYNQTFNSLFINNNGNVSFSTAYGTFSANDFPDGNFRMIAPFWADVDTRNVASGLVYYKITPTHIIVRWRNVGYFSNMADKLNDFQLILTNSNDSIIPIGSNVSFCYGDMAWTTGSASGGTNGFGGTPATVGANRGNNIDYVQFGRFDQAGTNYDGPFGAFDQVSWLDNKSFFFDVCTSNNNVAPVVSGINPCDTLQVCPGEVLNFNFSFLAPEQNQTVTTTINPTGVPNVTGSATVGVVSNVTAQFAPTDANLGTNVILFTGTDNGIPSASTTVTVVVNVTYPPVAPTITGDTIICPNQTTTLTATPGYFTYLWTPTNDTTNIISNVGAGQYIVRVDSGGCYAYDTINVIQVPDPVAAYTLQGNCLTGETTITATQDPSLTTYTFNPGNVVGTQIVVPNGNYTLTVVDTNTCQNTVNININQVSTLDVQEANNTNATCPGICDGAVNLDVTGNTGNYTVNWTPSNNPAEDPTNLCPGNYLVFVTDASGCIDSVNVTVGSNLLLSTQVTYTDVLCNGDNTGTAVITPTNGTGPFTYTWTPNVTNLGNPTNLAAGVYTVVTEDPNGCFITDSIIINQPPILRATPTDYPETCPGFCDGYIDFTLAGGISPYTLQVLLGSNTFAPNGNNTVDNLCGGTYQYVLVDDNGCVDSASVTINTLPPPTANFVWAVMSDTEFNPSVQFTSTSTGAVTWAWDFDGQGTANTEFPQFEFPGPNEYIVQLVITNQNNCPDTVVYPITINPTQTFYIPSSFTPNNDQVNDVFRPYGVFDDGTMAYQMEVFNRWGERIFTTKNIEIGWDGLERGVKIQDMVYNYRITLTDKTSDLVMQDYKGKIVLLR